MLGDESIGFTGGLLLVCDRGRPLEFHCTEPVLPSRAQQILYGATLREHACGDLIGGALLAKAKLPIGLLLVQDDATAAAGRGAGLPTVVAPPGAAPAEREPRLEQLAATIDPVEPFERVREAILEAQRFGAEGDRVAAA